MYEIYNEWPQIAKESSNENFQKIDFKSIDHIVFAGMGGSGSIGDVIGAILSKKDIHVTNVKGYLLPKTVDENTLVIATSVSGNSIEVLEILKNVKKMSTKVVGFSSGGKMVNILEEVIPINQNEINESILGLEETRKNISTDNLNENNKSLDLAKFVTDLPYIYYPAGLKSAAIRFKNSLQENTKTHALTEDVIESCHNGIVGWSMKSESNPIFIQGYNDHIKTIERWSILKQFFEDKKIQYKIVKSNEGGILSKIVNLIYLLDYTTIYSSVLRNIDPTPVEPIDYIKNKLDKN